MRNGIECQEKDLIGSNPSVTRYRTVDLAGMPPKLYQVHVRKLWVTTIAASLSLVRTVLSR